MAWYYYSGKITRSVPVKRGLSKSVKPGTRIEILELTLESKALIRKRELRITGKPKGAPSVADEPVLNTDVKGAVEKSEMALKFAEKGRTNSPGVPPVAKGGAEMTDAELNVPMIKSSAPVPGDDKDVTTPDDGKQPSDGVEEVDQDEELPDDSNKKGKKTRRRRG